MHQKPKPCGTETGIFEDYGANSNATAVKSSAIMLLDK